MKHTTKSGHKIKSGQIAQEIEKRFQAEVLAVMKLATPWWGLHKNGVAVPPLDAQKFVALKLLSERVFGNWAGTGAGKTASAGLASFVIGSKMTVVIAANSTVLGWKEQLEETFPGCHVYTEISHAQRGEGCFVILNYERFQGVNGPKTAAKVVALQPDFVVLDEIQLMKQGTGEASNRSVVIREMLAAMPTVHILGMSATPVINHLQEGISLLETIRQETSTLKSKANVPNALALYSALRQSGVRYTPDYKQTIETIKVVTQQDQLLPDLLAACANAKQSGNPILPIEVTLLPAKLEAIKDKIKPGTVIYIEYVTGMVAPIREFIESLGVRPRIAF